MPEPQRVFFSYPHADRAFAARLAGSLQEGLELDQVDSSTPAVRNGIEQLETRVLSAGSVVLLINPRSKFDESQQRIWQAILGAAWKNPKLRILPVLLRNAELPPFVRSAAAGGDVQAIRIQDSSDLRSTALAILESLRVTGNGVQPSRIITGGHLTGPGGQPFSLEIYHSSPEAARKERLERLAEMREYVEQLKR